MQNLKPCYTFSNSSKNIFGIKNKKAFTLVEVLMVVVIMFILLNALKTIVSNSQKDFINSQTCTNIASNKISNQINNALTSKLLYSGNTLISPEKYGINIFSTGVESYIISGTDITFLPDQKISFTGSDMDRINNCYSKSYRVIESGNIQNIELKKGLSPVDLSGFLINSDSSLTGESNFKFCQGNQSWSECKDIAKVFVDKRSMNAIQLKCIKWSGQKCTGPIGY